MALDKENLGRDEVQLDNIGLAGTSPGDGQFDLAQATGQQDQVGQQGQRSEEELTPQLDASGKPILGDDGQPILIPKAPP
ncbi:hypothetical protein N8500_02770, partial [Candidatus Puniceispirillum sp.]|nr:hypothetical protein [Candidatus Puniceispirillum sp.]